MIIFDLDGTLADREHRRHFVDLEKAEEKGICEEDVYCDIGGYQSHGWFYTNDPDRRWKPDWKSFYEACDKDTVIQPVCNIFHDLHRAEQKIQIWSGRCESVREKTIQWLIDNVRIDYCSKFCLVNDLKMRPTGDSTPDDQLKEKWLDECLASAGTVEMVFDDGKKVVEMWRRRGIFVFDVSQGKGDF